jgi:peroxiredoxin
MRRLCLASLIILILLVQAVPILSAWAQFPSPAPSFTLTDINGHSFSLSDFSGKPVALTFVAAKSVMCKTQLMILANVSKDVGNNATFIVIGVSSDMIRIAGDTDAQLQELKNGTGYNGIVARDTGTVSRDYNVTFIPMTFLIDTVGNIRYRHVGVVDSAESVLANELTIIPEYPTTAIILIALVFAAFVVAASARCSHWRNGSHERQTVEPQ